MATVTADDWMYVAETHQPSQEESMTTDSSAHRARVGDWVQARGLPGQPTRRGQITEVLGSDTHEHYRVCWDERHESILYPADGVTVLGHHPDGAPDPHGASRPRD
jgi:hypothetical protein